MRDVGFHLISHSNLLSFPPAQHRGEGGQLSLLASSQHVLPQAVGHLKGDACKHVLHVFLEKGAQTNRAILGGSVDSLGTSRKDPHWNIFLQLAQKTQRVSKLWERSETLEIIMSSAFSKISSRPKSRLTTKRAKLEWSCDTAVALTPVYVPPC